MKKILFVGAEAMPFAATGGLGDVLGSLPAALAAEGTADVRVVMPLHRGVSEAWRSRMTTEAEFSVGLAWRQQYCGIKSLEKDGVKYYFVDNEYYFNRDALYGSFDDGERFAYFCKAVLEMFDKIGYHPDVINANDWQAALCPIYLDCIYRGRPGYENIKTVFTIHNIEYQGQYGFSILGDVFALTEEDHSTVEYGDCINLMKAAIECSHKVTTVSPKYAEEIRGSEYSHGLSHILNKYAYKLCGILNGIDYNYYDPQNDPAIACRYSASDFAVGKRENKRDLQKKLGLPERDDVPMIALISRLASHKGLDLVANIAQKILNDDVQFVVLGRGEARFEDFFKSLEARYPDKMRALIEYDRDLSKRIYAAADIFLMPSKSEPCGLSQMIASRYGAIPVVRETGGLYDSIKGYWEHDGVVEGNGFTFANYNAEELLDRVNAATAIWKDQTKRKNLIDRIMTVDFSWASSAKQYLGMYESL